MKVLITGSSGMLGYTLVRYLIKETNIDIAFTLRNNDQINNFKGIFKNNSYYSFDANYMEELEPIISDYKPDICINCIGIIKKKFDSKDNIQNISINSLFPHYLDNICKKHNSRFLHISTDCVFSGRKGNYSEIDIPDPIDLYGRSKLLGEVNNHNSATIRTSIIGHEYSTKNGLLEWLLGSKNDVEGYKNAIFSGLTTLELSKVIHKYFIIKSDLRGLFHVSSNPISKNDLLLLIKNIYKLKINIKPEFKTLIDRSLCGLKFQKISGYKPKKWHDLIEELKSFG